MSFSYENARDAQKITEQLSRVERSYKVIAAVLAKNPHSLDCDPYKNEVIQMLISHLNVKMEHSKTKEDRNYNPQYCVILEMFLEWWDEYGNREYARKILEAMMELSVQELKYIPNDIKERAFEVCKQLIKGEI